jgi:prolyl-tRNA synthetase
LDLFDKQRFIKQASYIFHFKEEQAMNFTRTFIPTQREIPADAVAVSHRLMFRAGMIRKLSNGLFAFLPLGLRSLRKVDQIGREEMDAVGGQELKIPVVQPADLWRESGRWDTIGDVMLRVKNRTGVDLVITPTAEEAIVSLVRDELSSYRQLPLIVYQTNTKYRDEIRPRYGVVRGREFTMNDAYSFHANDESLDETYKAMGKAYHRVFKRCGLSTITVKADSGAIGGANSEEFMVESNIGDNTLILCKSCNYAANVEKAVCKPDFDAPASAEEGKRRAEAAGIPPMDKYKTPAVKTIDDLCVFFNKETDLFGDLKVEASRFIKTLIYRAVNVEIDLSNAPGGSKLEKKKIAHDTPEIYPEVFFAVAIRGDLDVNEIKLTGLLKASEVMLAEPADVVRITGAPVGFAGPVGLTGTPVIVDASVTAMDNAVTGALAEDWHYIHIAYGRDYVPWMVADVRNVAGGNTCAQCGGELYEKKGNELGHIFKLERKYSRPMKVYFLDEKGRPQIPTMGTYGIGVDRTLASVIEEYHDDDGIVWPMTVAPYHVIIIPIRYEGALKTVSDQLAADLEKRGIEVLLDDRDERPGVKFVDADLIGIPYRVVVGEQNAAKSVPALEIKRRGEKESQIVEVSKAAAVLADKVNAELAELNK